MTGDLIALRTFLRSGVWAMHEPTLKALAYSILTASSMDGALARARELHAAMPSRRLANPQRGTTVGVLPIMGVLTGRPSVFSELFGWPTVASLRTQ